MIGKLVNGELVEAPKKIVIANPTDELLISLMGFKPVVDDNNPIYDDSKEYLAASYKEQEDKIIRHYEVKPIPEDEEDKK